MTEVETALLRRIAEALESIDRRLASMDEHIDMTGETVGEIARELEGKE